MFRAISLILLILCLVSPRVQAECDPHENLSRPLVDSYVKYAGEIRKAAEQSHTDSLLLGSDEGMLVVPVKSSDFARVIAATQFDHLIPLLTKYHSYKVRVIVLGDRGGSLDPTGDWLSWIDIIPLNNGTPNVALIEGFNQTAVPGEGTLRTHYVRTAYEAGDLVKILLRH